MSQADTIHDLLMGINCGPHPEVAMGQSNAAFLKLVEHSRAVRKASKDLYEAAQRVTCGQCWCWQRNMCPVHVHVHKVHPMAYVSDCKHFMLPHPEG